MVTKEELDAALLDVRKAYRLIALFQRRTRDLCVEIAEAFSTKMAFYVWEPSQNDRPPRSTVSPFGGRWIWDFLPLYDFCVLYLPEDIDQQNHNPGDWMLCVRISADSGYKTLRSSEPDPRDFEEAASCESIVRLYIYYSKQAFRADWYQEVYSKNDFPPDDREHSFNDGQILAFGKRFSLSELSDGTAVRHCIDEFRRELSNTFPQTQW